MLRRFTAPGESVNTGTYRAYEMPIRNGRPVSDQFTLDRNGFEVTRHVSAVSDFTDKAEVDRVYPGEVAEFVKARTGADRVAPLGWVLRRSAAAAENSSQPQAALVHCDFSVTGARPRAETAYAERFPEAPGFRRALLTSVWRVFSPPPQDWPLALCDAASVGPDEGLDNRLYFVDKIPADLYAEMPPDAPGTSGFEFHHNPGHQWWYFPDMTRDEVLFFKFNDSDHSRAWRVPHSAFRDTTAEATEPRHSIEFRVAAYFELLPMELERQAWNDEGREEERDEPLAGAPEGDHVVVGGIEGHGSARVPATADLERMPSGFDWRLERLVHFNRSDTFTIDEDIVGGATNLHPD